MKISVITPCFNEEKNVGNFYEKCREVLDGLCDFEVIFIDDGSVDGTFEQLTALAAKDSRVQYISFSRNFGHQNALKAGLDHASGDCVVSIDADGQQPLELLPEMLELWKSGYEVVYTLREEDEKISFFKKITSKLFYRLNGLISDVKVDSGAADFRLLDRKVVDALKQLPENDLFWRGLVAWIGFKQIALPYRAKPRQFGSSQYTLKKMLSLAFSGMTSFSTRPMKVSLLVGILLLGICFIYAIYIFVVSIRGRAVSGWPSLALLIIFFGGMQFLFLGIMGEYLGRLFMATKRRPCYFIRQTNMKNPDNDHQISQ